GSPQDGPAFPDVAFQPIAASRWWPGNVNVRFAQALRRAILASAPALVEVHNRPEIAIRLARRLPQIPVTLLLNNDPQSMRAARRAEQRATLLKQLALVMASSDYLRQRLLDGVQGAPPVALLPNCLDLSELPLPRTR